MKTLYRQFIGATILILTISIVVAFLLANIVYSTFTKDKLISQNINVAESIISHINDSYLDLNMLDTYFNSIGQLGYQLYLIDYNGHAKSYGEPFHQTKLPPHVISQVINGENYIGSNSFWSAISMMRHFSNSLENTVGIPLHFKGENYAFFLKPDSQMLFSDFHVIILGFTFSVMLISIIGVVVMTKKIIKPISQLTEATKLITKEDFNFSLDIQRQDEIGQLAESFHTMQMELKQNIEARKSFISNVSHDFQSPLMNIQGYADLLQQDESLTTDHRTYANIIVEESKRLSLLTKQLLLITSLDHDSYPIKWEMVQLDQQLKGVIMKQQWYLDEKNIDITYKLSPVRIQADSGLLLNVWENLLVNAIKYNTDNGSIAVSCKQTGDVVEVTFTDTGIGIPEESLPYLFDRFYRVDKARNRNGTGLGLSIVEQSLAKLNGRIDVFSKEGEGTTFIVKLNVLKEV